MPRQMSEQPGKPRPKGKGYGVKAEIVDPLGNILKFLSGCSVSVALATATVLGLAGWTALRHLHLQ